jgi:hypothetical protein
MKDKIGIWLKENWFKLAIIICILMVVIGELVKIRDGQLKGQANSAALKKCLSAVESRYSSDWDSECTINGMNGKKKGCTLPTWVVTRLDDMMMKDKDNCFKQYPQS